MGEDFGLEDRERVAAEVRHWVRLTRRCNNRCVFCLDSEVQDGSVVGWNEILEEFRKGLARGAKRVILSGGEPTIHPRFLEAVAEARRLGYEWVQVVSNGRMFAYWSFASKAVAAGLSEATLSLPAHEPALFRRLVAVPEAFEQSLAGLRNLLRLQVVVSVDVVVSALNAAVLPEILAFYIDLGVREFDLLQVVPFGRAFRNLARLRLEPERHAEPIHRALRLALGAGAVVWTNRMAPAFLEGFEDLIQDPHKLADEVAGRLEALRAKMAGQPMPCEAPERCAACFLEGYCRTADRLLAGLERGTLWLRVSDWGPREQRAWADHEFQGLWLRAEQPDWAADLWKRICDALEGRAAPGAVVLELERWSHDGLEALSGLPIRQVRLLEAPATEPDVPEDLVLAVALTRGNWERVQDWQRPVRLFAPERTSAAEARAQDVPPEVLASAPRRFPLEDLPVCLGDGRTASGPEPLDGELFDEGGRLDPLALVDWHIQRSWRVFATRCRGCPCRERCPGMPIQWARAFGLSVLEPRRCVRSHSG